MTLSTDVYILDEVDPAEVFRFCQELLAHYDDPRHLPAEQQRVRDEQDTSYTGTPGVWEVQPGNPWSRDNEPGQGLPAWLLTAYRPDGPLRTPEQAAEHNEYCEDDCDGDHHDRACWMSVDFDTAYGYRDARRWNCGDLHAALVNALGLWLEAKSVRFEWRNEYSGEIFTGRAGLATLGTGGAEADEWFRREALPAMLAHAASEGAESVNVFGVGEINLGGAK